MDLQIEHATHCFHDLMCYICHAAAACPGVVEEKVKGDRLPRSHSDSVRFDFDCGTYSDIAICYIDNNNTDEYTPTARSHMGWW